jgi:hypothetical protein
LIRDSDEQVFEALRFPEERRAAVRRINDEHALQVTELLMARTKASGGTDSPTDSVGAGTEEVDGLRRNALRRLLGRDGSREFETTELSFATMVRAHHGRQAVRQAAPEEQRAR